MALLFLGFLFLVFWIVKLQDRVRDLEQRDEERLSAIESLRAQLEERWRPADAVTTRGIAPVEAVDQPRRQPAPPPPSAPPPPLSLPAQPPPPPRPASAAPLPRPAEWPSPPLRPSLPGAAVRPATALAASGARATRTLPAAPPPVPPAPPPSGAAGGELPPSQPFDWEALVGVKLFSWVAGVAMALAAIFFLGYSIQNGWLQPPVRMAIGLAVGVGLLVACELRVARNYAVTANAMDAAGIVTLFSTIFASFALWHLLGAGAAFGLFVLVTVVAVTLSIRRDSIFIALLGLVGGFSTPALLSTGQDSPIGLFGYLLLLNAGLAWVAYRKRWVALVALSLVFTTLYQWAWVMKFLSEERLPLAGGIFVVFPVLAVAALAVSQRSARRGPGESSPAGEVAVAASERFRLLVAVNAALPLIFALYLATVPAYGQHYWVLFGFLLCLDAGLFAIARWRGPQALHVFGAASTVIAFLVWLSGTYARPDTSASWPSSLVLVSLFVALYLACGLVRWADDTGEGASIGTPASPSMAVPVASLAVYAAPLLLLAFPVLAANEPQFTSPALGFSTLFALLALMAAFAIAREAGMVYFLAAVIALATEAVWSGLHLVPDRLLPALVVYGGFGLFYLGVPLLARRWGRPLRPQAMPGALLLASIALLFFLSFGAVAPGALWGLALLLGVLNLAMFAEAGTGRHPLLLPAASGLSWLVLVAWWLSGNLATQAIPAMMIVGGFSVLTLAGHFWVGARDGSDAAPGGGMALALVGHLFLVFVAAQPSLSIPPWPLFGVLAVLDLAIGVASLHVRRGEAHFAAIVLTQCILVLWVVIAPAAPWPSVAAVAAGVAGAFAGCWSWLARRRVKAPELDLFDASGAAGFLLAQVVLFVSAIPAGAPPVALLALFHALFAIALLALATLARTPIVVVLAVLVPWLATWAWQALHPGPGYWWQNLELSAPTYLVFLAYPLALGRRAERRIGPSLAAVLASGSFFHVARLSLVAGGYGTVIGALPIVQAVLLAPLLVALLRVEAPGERTAGRLALVAGAVLAFVTVAIPLQLEKEWITIGWALEGAALAWLYRRIPHRGLFWSSLALMAVVFARLAVNPEVLIYQPRGELRLLNWYLYAYLLCALAMYAAARLYAGTEDRIGPELPSASTILPAGATVLLFLLLNLEIADYFSTGPSITFNLSAGLAQDLTYTLGWGAFAVALLAAGIFLRSYFARMSAIVLLTVTVLKGFLHDMARLGGLYRVFSFVGLAVCLSLVAVVLQRFVLQRKTEAGR